MSEPFEIREDKVSMIVTTPSDGSGFKTEAMWLIEACGGRWVHKVDGYRMTERQVKNLKKLHAAGCKGCIRVGRWTPALFTFDGIHKFRLSDALAHCFSEPMRDWQDIAQGYKEGASQ